MAVKTLAVIGGGTMGNGIAHVAAQSNFPVFLVEADQARLDKALGTIRKNMERQVAKGVITEVAMTEAMGRITGTTDLEKLSGVDLAIEAVFENFEVKAGIFKELDRILPANAIIATNTSAISITALAAQTKRAERCIGMHFMNPVPLMKLVEIVKALTTSDETYATTVELAAALGKTPVLVSDYPGFISNRVLMPMINEAVFCLYEGVADAEAIDTVMKLGMNHPMGPLALADLIGLDICLDIMKVLYSGFHDGKYRPCPLLVKMVESGRLGRKTGRGFYDYAAK